ncbi:c2h2 finger domain-containing protein [Paramyrothecium foliicola]|nr:c2h2 finger domain-containing protein [Paramyrothecium foliicola]
MNGVSFPCRVCGVAFGDANEQRQHMKSDSHILQLRIRIAPEGTTISPLGAHASNTSSSEYDELWSQSGPESESDGSEETERDDGFVESSDATVNFVKDQCLFCGIISDTLDVSLAHMHGVHSFSIPFQHLLAVEVETLIWYLHLVVYNYHECLSCGKGCRSLEAVHQHMLAKGHCRFDLNEEYSDFYHQTPEAQGASLIRPDETSLPLSSGKVLAHRASAHVTLARSHTPREGQSRQQRTNDVTPIDAAGNVELVTRQDRRLGAGALQVSRLSSNDQRALAHLPQSEQRSALAARKQQLEKAQREERRQRNRVELLGNKALMKHFKNDVPGRSNG